MSVAIIGNGYGALHLALRESCAGGTQMQARPQSVYAIGLSVRSWPSRDRASAWTANQCWTSVASG